MVAFYWKLLFLGRTIGGLDVVDYFYPYRAYASHAIHAGRLPLWNPDIFGGVPFLANIQAAVLYPPSALFYLLDEPTAYSWSVGLHTFLGALFAYLFARQSLTLGRTGSLIGAMVFAFGGFMGGQMDHLNQLSAAIWLPALLLCWDKAAAGRLLYMLLGALVVALQFLAGHPQESYLMLVVLALYAAYRMLTNWERPVAVNLRNTMLAVVVVLGLGATLAAVQLLPTSELASWSIRANGLTYQQATAVSLKASMLPMALLPPFGNADWLLIPPNSEFLGYTGITAMLLAMVAVAVGRRRHTLFFALLAVLGLALALGQQNPVYPLLFKVVPGFDSLRVPARWLFVYSFGVAMLAALGADALFRQGSARHWRRWLGWVAAAILACELWVAGQNLGYSHPTPNIVFTQSPEPVRVLQSAAGPFRVLSVAQDIFAPGIEPAVRRQYSGSLNERELLDYLRNYKLREILEPDTTMAAGIATIDGYDGGLLPLARYVPFKDALTQLPSAPDDRVRFVVKWLPNRGLLDLTGVRYVLTDALNDKSESGVSYDLSSFMHVSQQQSQATFTFAEPHQATAVGVVVAAKPVVPLPSDRIVATLTLTAEDGSRTSVPVPYGGLDLGQLPYREQLPARLAAATLDSAMTVRSVTVAIGAEPTTDVFVNGLALIDGPSGNSYSPLLAPGPEMTKVLQGDVKLYQNPSALPPAFLIHEAVAADDSREAATALQAGFDPARTGIVEGNAQPPASVSLLGRVIRRLRQSLNPEAPFTVPENWLNGAAGHEQDRVTTEEFEPEHVSVTTNSDTPGFLVLSQSFYPGWEATVDGAQARIVAADLLFQAVHLDAGLHRVEFRFRPRSVVAGAAISLGSCALWLTGLGVCLVRRRGGNR